MQKALMIFVALLLIVSSAQAEFVDYRAYTRDTTPEKFEQAADLSALYPDSLTLFTKEHIPLWEVYNVVDVKTFGDNISAILRDGAVYFSDGACNGIIAPDNATGFEFNGDWMVITADGKNHLYNIQLCAMYNRFPAKGEMKSISQDVFCEASPDVRTVRHTQTGELLYADNPEKPVLATFAGAGGCYFLDADGHVELYSLASRQMGYFTYTDDNIISAESSDSGFAILAGERHMTVRLSDFSALIEYTDPESYDVPDLYDVATGKLYVGPETLMILEDNTLKAFTREKLWSKKLQTLFPEPVGGDWEPIFFKDDRILYKSGDGEKIYYYINEIGVVNGKSLR